MTRPIELLRVGGDRAAAGRAIGRACADVVGEAAAAAAARGLVAAAAPYRAVTAEELPWVVEELDAVATGAGADPLAVFAASIEELVPDDVEEPRAALQGRCSDLMAGPPATADAHLLVAHNNDLAPADEDRVIAIEWAVEGEPRIFTLGIGPWISVGWNEAGLSLTGNELCPSDDRVGIPRLLQVRDMLTRRTLADAVAAALHPRRASSYNNLLAHRDGGVANVEGSATDAEVTGLSPGGTLAHTNHYACERMRRFEANPYAGGSAARLARARDRLAPAEAGAERLDGDAMFAALTDHAGAPDSLCRHTDDPAGTKTVFWCVADVTEGVIRYGRGNPCSSSPQVYAFG